MSRVEAIAFIVRGSGSHFDPAVVDAFAAIAPGLHDEFDAADLVPQAVSAGAGATSQVVDEDLLHQFDTPPERVSPWRGGGL